MKADIKKKWIKALRSGKYKQATRTLKDADGGYCCLGVLCEISKIGHFEDGTYICPNSRMDGVLPDEVMVWAGLKDCRGTVKGYEDACLSEMNDVGGKSFKEIADVIEREF